MAAADGRPYFLTGNSGMIAAFVGEYPDHPYPKGKRTHDRSAGSYLRNNGYARREVAQEPADLRLRLHEPGGGAVAGHLLDDGAAFLGKRAARLPAHFRGIVDLLFQDQ